MFTCKSYLVFVFFLILVTSHSEAQLSLSLVDAPESSLVFTPTFITVVIENRSALPVLIFKGAQMEVGQPNGHLDILPGSESDQLFDDVMWLKSGEKYFEQHDIVRNLSHEGIYEVRAIYRSSGRCRVGPQDQRFARAKRLPREEGTDPLVDYVECWAGNLTSSTVKVSVFMPAKSEDKQALEFVLKRSISGFINTKMGHAYFYLKSNFPNSYYTYAAAFYRTEGYPEQNLEEVMRLQPNHPLSRYAKTQWAIKVISEFYRPDRSNREMLPTIVPAQLGISKPLQEYVEQMQQFKKVEYEAEVLRSSGRP